jgi:hypothetical protein
VTIYFLAMNTDLRFLSLVDKGASSFPSHRLLSPHGERARVRRNVLADQSNELPRQCQQAVEKPSWTPENTEPHTIADGIGRACRMFKKTGVLTRPTPARRDAPFRGCDRSERSGEAYFFPYVEPLSAARTKLEDFFNILLAHIVHDGSSRNCEVAMRWTHCMEKSNGCPRVEPRGREAYLKQYVDGLSGEPARLAV